MFVEFRTNETILTSAELTQLTQTLAMRIGRYLERQGRPERDAENSYLAGEAVEARVELPFPDSYMLLP